LENYVNAQPHICNKVKSYKVKKKIYVKASAEQPQAFG
jgi:hypothetical protein